MNTEIAQIVRQNQSDNATNNSLVEAIGQAADTAARRHIFDDYVSRKATNTIAAQRTDLESWSEFLASLGYKPCEDTANLQRYPELWGGVSWGMVESYVKWLLRQGYSIASVNRKLSTVKTYCKLAAKAGAIDPEVATLIRSVSGYSQKEGKRINEKRKTSRIGSKKATHVSLTLEDAQQLKVRPDTQQGRRDAVIMTLLLDHGLRVGELSHLRVADFNIRDRTFTFYRAKVDATQTHLMSRDTFRAISNWFESGDAPALGPLLRGSRKGGKLTTAGMSDRAITARVRKLGKEIGILGLSAHDCRHYWATRAASMGTDAFALRDAGGWSSIAMPARYVESAAIANERVRL